MNERREFNFQCTEWRGKGVFLLLIVLTVFGLLCSVLPFPKMSTNALIVPNTDINEQIIKQTKRNTSRPVSSNKIYTVSPEYDSVVHHLTHRKYDADNLSSSKAYFTTSLVALFQVPRTFYILLWILSFPHTLHAPQEVTT